MLLLLLVLGNLAAFAWWQGWIASWGPSSAERVDRSAEIAPERLRVVSGVRLEGAAPASLPGAADAGQETAAGKDSGALAAPDAQGSVAPGAQAPRIEGARGSAEAAPAMTRRNT